MREGDDAVGTVYLVGSGPGDPDLLTVRAAELIESADVVLHDKLPGPEILGRIPEAKREDVGKRAGGEWTPQEYTNRRLVELAREGNSVVRLKGGDPFVFGRGGEEAEHLAEAGVPFEVVPGVTSAIAGPAVAGIPVTHRDHASSVSFVTGHEDPTKPDSMGDWEVVDTVIEDNGEFGVLAAGAGGNWSIRESSVRNNGDATANRIPAAGVVADEYDAYETAIIERAIEYAREEATGSGAQFIGQLTAFVDDRDRRVLIYDRLRRKVERRQAKREDVSGLFD